MKLLVFSDTHGNSEPMLHIVKQHSDVGACFFLGDGLSDADVLSEKFPKLPIYRVRGNCDFASFDPVEGLVAFEGFLFYYTHGHELGVKHGIERIYQRSVAQGADVALFGHTHIAYYNNINDLHLFNPGSPCLPRGGPPSYGLITIQNATLTIDTCLYEK